MHEGAWVRVYWSGEKNCINFLLCRSNGFVTLSGAPNRPNWGSAEPNLYRTDRNEIRPEPNPCRTGRNRIHAEPAETESMLIIQPRNTFLKNTHHSIMSIWMYYYNSFKTGKKWEIYFIRFGRIRRFGAPLDWRYNFDWYKDTKNISGVKSRRAVILASDWLKVF